jgi:signal transduction protein with GAF and PtsI domain
MLSGCNDESAELRDLRAENDRLKMALAQAQATAAGMHDGSDTPAADLDLAVADLWSQRFEDNQFRSKQRLDQKQIRVTGIVESVLERSVVIFGTGTRLGSVSMVAQLDDEYVAQVADGLAALHKGTEITLQGRFIYEKMGLQDAVIIDRQTGWRLTSKDLANFTDPAAVSVAGRVPLRPEPR